MLAPSKAGSTGLWIKVLKTLHNFLVLFLSYHVQSRQQTTSIAMSGPPAATAASQTCLRCSRSIWGSGCRGPASSQPWVPAPAARAAASGRCHRQRRSRHPAALPEAASTLIVLLDAATAPVYVDPALAADTFEPQLRPEIVVAAACAAAPPIIFWARIFASQMRRVRAIEQEKVAEQQRAEERAVRHRVEAGPGWESVCKRTVVLHALVTWQRCSARARLYLSFSS